MKSGLTIRKPEVKVSCWETQYISQIISLHLFMQMFGKCKIKNYVQQIRGEGIQHLFDSYCLKEMSCKTELDKFKQDCKQCWSQIRNYFNNCCTWTTLNLTSNISPVSSKRWRASSKGGLKDHIENLQAVVILWVLCQSHNNFPLQGES